MRTTLNIDEEVIKQILQITGIKNKSKAVNKILERYVREEKRKKILKMKGKLNLDDNWKQIREMELNEN